MKKLMDVRRKFNVPILLGFLVVLVLSACKKDDPVNTRTPAAGLVAYNLAPDKPAVGFTLSGNTFGNGILTYNGYTGNYLPIYIGNREVRSFDYNTGSTIAISNNTFKDSAYYSLFLVGNNGAYKNVVVEDNYDNVIPTSGKAWVRYVNAITDSVAKPTVTIGSIVNETANFSTVSNFKQVATGSINTSVTNGGNINVSRSLNFEENKIYTVLFVGSPNATDSSKAVKIRYIENGTATL
jgi:hypothetical protein